jgi:hypothetical protein
MKPLMLLIICCCIMAAGCAAPTRDGDPTLHSKQVREEFFTAREVRVHRFSAEGCRMSDAAFAAAVATIESHLHRPIRVIDHGVAKTWGEGGPAAPIEDRGRLVTGADVQAAGGVFRMSEPQDGILGAALFGNEPGFGNVRVLAEPGTIVVVEMTGPEGGVGVTGFADFLAVDRADGLPRWREGLVVIHHGVIQRRSNWFVSEAKLSQWTLTHEIGHVLGVPSSNSHIWFVPGLGPHCTDPRCVMYTGFDWRVLWTGIVRGWPMDFCKACSKELEAARTGQSAPPPDESGGPDAPPAQRTP